MRLVATFVALILGSVTPPSRADLGPDNVSGLALRWSISGPSGFTGAPILTDGVLVVTSFDGNLRGLDPVTGAERWVVSGFGPIPGGAMVTGDGGVCVGDLLATVSCHDTADGRQRWRTNLTDPAPAAVWSSLHHANGRLFVSIASQTDSPCTRGRLVALDLATGNELWRFYTVPEKICSTDTATTCTGDGDCPAGGQCIAGRGGGVTASVVTDPTGEWVYMNTVGCYTFPSIGESETIFKINAANGQVSWRNRVTPPEQFGACAADTRVDCGTDADCSGVGGTCETKVFYHDFGFLNGPLYLPAPAGLAAETLLVSGGKHGTLYAFDEADGEIVWSNAVVPTPISPGFANFGLFNGSIEHAGGRIFAALNFKSPASACRDDARQSCRSDADCASGPCVLEPEHLKAFDLATGAEAWSAEIGRSWSKVAVVNGVVYAGTNTEGDGSSSSLFLHRADTGARLTTLPLPAPSSARSLVAGNTVFVAYGNLSPGGLSAFGLCGNGTLDGGEACDDGNIAAGDCCAADCTIDAAAPPASTPALTFATCTLGAIVATPCGAETVPKGLQRLLDRTVKRVRSSVTKADELADRGKTAKAERVRGAMLRQLDATGKATTRAAQSTKTGKSITAECRAAIDQRVARSRALLVGVPF